MGLQAKGCWYHQKPEAGPEQIPHQSPQKQPTLLTP